MRGYRDGVITRVKAHYVSKGYKVLSIRIEDGTIYIECEGKSFKENVDEWM